MAAIAPVSALRTHPFEPIAGIRTIFDAMQVLRKTSTDYGFRCFMVITLPTKISEGSETIAGMSVVSSWPPEMIAEYDRLELARNSPVLERLRKQITPLVFEVGEISRIRPEQESETATGLFRRYDLTMGVYFPVRDCQGLGHAVSFMGDRKPLGAEELAVLALFSTLLIERITSISASDTAVKSVLSGRETEILRWTAEGKTSSEIARITGLSEHTVNHYATIATQKLGCSNRTQAVVHAIRMGLLR
ncbi:helix-turn-helix transcriptional regulator [Hoeflea olei]|uniref:HTH luxR-type domain-containing protein n=1 Tax=Hoeflea olei TaxID=1480615 RepID=A0A1C1YUW0_9HYPH|nr:LuxR family transcriptional regulator [Hoeflea olei]OCW57245.1 hypothetical protein AWJ14_13095 [Hoeflea olei]